MYGTSLVAFVVKNLPNNAGDIRDLGLIPGSGRSPGRGHGNPLQYSCLENPMDGEAWQADVHRVAQSWTRLKRPCVHRRKTFHFFIGGRGGGWGLGFPRCLSGYRILL